jgi:hypothetical protein
VQDLNGGHEQASDVDIDVLKPTYAFWIHCSRDQHTGPLRVRVSSLSNPDVHVRAGSFLVRVWIDRHNRLDRCQVRHVASGEETRVQGGPGLSAFVRRHLLEDDGSAGQRSPDPGTALPAMGQEYTTAFREDEQ